MSTIYYTAKRSLSAGRVAGVAYVFEVPLRQFEHETAAQKNTVTSLSGVRHTLLHRLEKFRNAETVVLNDAAMIAQMDEFLDSVSGGEWFQIDEHGSAQSPVVLVNYVLDGDYKKARVGRSDRFTYSFKVVAQ